MYQLGEIFLMLDNGKKKNKKKVKSKLYLKLYIFVKKN